ncbi:hypothetical protein [Salinigranum sp. GCM10025319]|uniref:Tc toxin subunit A-related protein n=1 Tax=Salinigranum sp. GCM10025319 TaxID=3252687 RepID=UPI003606BCEE
MDDIQSALARANRQYRAGEFADAIESYKRARSLIYQFLNPAHRANVYVANDLIRLPVSREIETKIAEAGLRLAEAAQADVTESSPPIRVFGVDDDDGLARFDSLGYTEGTSGVDVGKNAALGADLLAEKRPREAIEVLTATMEAIGDPATDEDRATTAAIALNLSAAYQLYGDHDQARKLAQTAERRFEEIDDGVGAAQARHNLGVSYARAGNENEGTRTLTESAAMFRTVENGWYGRSRGGTITATDVTTGFQPSRLARTTLSPSFARSVATFPTRTVPETTTAEVRTEAAVPDVRAEPDRTTTASTATPLVVEPATDLDALAFVRERDTDTLAVRWPGTTGGWAGVPVFTPAEEKAQERSWALGVAAGEDIVALAWERGQRPESTTLLEQVYRPRIDTDDIAALGLRITAPGVITAYLPHLYAFVIPQALGDCYHELGKFARAEEHYLDAAEYSYLNRRYEAPALWARLAENAVAWGDHEYRREEIERCMGIYGRLVTEEGEAPDDSPLYTIEAFAGVADDAREIIERLDEADPLGVDTATSGEMADPLSGFDPSIARPLAIAWARWSYLTAGLDFFGTTFTPIFTFEYLQTVAEGFAERAVGAEREFVNFQTRAEAEAATRRELESAAALAEAEADVRREQYLGAVDEWQATQRAVDLAETRAQNAREDLDNYRTAGWWQYKTQSIATAHGAQEDWHGNEIRDLASDIERGSWEGDYGKLAAAATYLGGKKSYEYQVARHENTVEDLEATIPVAREQAQAAEHRRRAAHQAWLASLQRERMAEDALDAFDDELFTPELWRRMALMMRGLARDYKETAIRTAKLMERAYNFETDSERRVIRSEYAPGATEGLLGADLLLRDVESFTFHRIANHDRKETQVKDVVSLATEYPIAFYDFQRTGRLSFETVLYDFDRRHPGLYGQRIEAVEVEVVGLLPPTGVTGTLRAGGLSRYRTVAGGERLRIHTTDTMALSEFELREDAFVYRADTGVRGLFEGVGVATTWALNLPKRSNDLPYDRIADVRIVLYYTAKYDPGLEATVEAREPLPGELRGVRDLRPRYDYPEAWYAFLDGDDLTYEVAREDLPYTETNFRVEGVAVRLLPSEEVADDADLSGIEVTLSLPGTESVTLATDADGEVTSEADALSAELGGDLLGTWSVGLAPPAGSPLADDDGALARDRLFDVAVVVEYGYDWPE